MRAATLTGIRELELVDTPPPVLTDPEDVRIRMKTVGICGSDVHYYTTGRIGSQVVHYPYMVGHEGAGVVEEIGASVTQLKPGDRVAIDPAVSCHKCDQCRAGREHTCRNLKFLGCPGQMDGCLCDDLVMPAKCCYPIPETMSMEEAALIEPLSIGVYAVQHSIPMANAKIGILGMGPIGLSVMQAAQAANAAAVYATDRLDYRCEAATRHGAEWTGNPDRVNIAESVHELEALGLDVVFECCGQQEALDQAFELLKPGGTVMIVGIPEFDRFSFPADTARRHELRLQHVRRQNNCVQKAIDLVASGKIQPDFMVTHRFELAQSKTAFDLVDQYADGVVKAMIHFD
ncbi:MAG: alcohol dehydrogenase catalytic domain-containing protein [Candidatus Pacebacteria bacterium]|nr:alcohol dehydrogenase catalytic domain-containing protein [Candidatus Paceibacterota bacterium]